jgi:hypothetical protein
MSNSSWLIPLSVGIFVALIVWALTRAAKLKRIELTCSIKVRTERTRAYDFIRHQANFPAWSPFLAEDPTQTYKLVGADGEVGGQYHWIGRGGKDVGLQEIAALEAGRRIAMRCRIEKPFKAQPTFAYTVADAPDGGVLVTQVFELQSALADAFFLWLFGVKKQMAATNEKGMALLREALEAKR